MTGGLLAPARAGTARLRRSGRTGGLLRFVLRRLLQAVVTLFIATFLYHVGIALMMHKVTAAPFSAFFSFHGFFDYIGKLATGDLGYDGDQPSRLVADRLSEGTWNTVRLAIIAMTIQLTIGVVAGVVSAITRRPFVDTLITVLTLIVLSTPLFAAAVIVKNFLSGAQLFGVTIFAVVPTRFVHEPAWITQVALPALTLALADVAFITRLARTSMLEVLAQDYLRTARAKGLSERRVIWKHGLRNALVPVLSYATIGLGIFLGGTFIVELIFDYPGLGNQLYVGFFKHHDVPLLKAGVVYLTTVFLVLSALMDIVCRWLDPRVRLS